MAKFVLVVSVIMVASSGLVRFAAAADNNWYVGQGVKANMYVTYRIASHDTNQGQPFTMTIYFKEYNATGHYWVAPVYVNDQGAIINGTLHLSDLYLTA